MLMFYCIEHILKVRPPNSLDYRARYDTPAICVPYQDKSLAIVTNTTSEDQLSMIRTLSLSLKRFLYSKGPKNGVLVFCFCFF